jgi:hypothetical protein
VLDGDVIAEEPRPLGAGAGLAVFSHERQAYGNSLGDEECAEIFAILDRLQATGSA